MSQVIVAGLVPELSNFMKLVFLTLLSYHQNNFTKAKFTVKCISRSVLVSGPSHAANDSKRKLLSASMSQLHKILQFIKTYGWPGMFIGILLLCKHMIFL